MPLHVRSIAVSIAVICFFTISLIGWASGLMPFVCCKRALIGSVLAYIAGGWAVKAINSVLVSAMITDRMNEHGDGNPTTARNATLGDRNSGASD